MKYNICLLVILFLGCKTTSEVVSPEIDENIMITDLSKEQVDVITEVLSKFPNESEIAIAIVNNDKTTFYGLKRQNDIIRKTINHQSVFEVGSISKVFTTHLLLNAINDGLIENLESLIQDYSSFTIRGNPQITFKQLANHTSGLPNNISTSIFNTNRSNPYKKWDEEKFNKFLKEDIEITSIPGEKYIYSNVGMAVLANTISRLKSEKYELLLQNEIFKPLQMTSSTTNRENVQDLLVQGYNWKGKETENWDLAAFEGAGAVLSTSEDLSLYLKWCFAALKTELNIMSQPTISIDDKFAVSLGWHIVKGYTTEPFLWHNGGTGGYKSSMGVNLSNNTGIVILTNIGATNNPQKGMIDKLCYRLIKTIEE